MTTKAGGSGNALNATISTDEPTGNQASDRERLGAAVESARIKVERLKEHLAGAEGALADAEAALAEQED